MKLSVKKVKVLQQMSEETLCFSADLYDNNKLVAHVSNTGRGGSNIIHPAKNLTYKDVAKYDTLDIECEIAELVEVTDLVKRNQGRSIVIKKDGKFYTHKTPQSIAQLKKNQPSWLVNAAKQLKKQGYEILNTNFKV